MCVVFCCSYLEVHENNPDIDRNETLGKFIESRHYSELFQNAYLVSYLNMRGGFFFNFFFNYVSVIQFSLLSYLVAIVMSLSYRFQYVVQSGHALQKGL